MSLLSRKTTISTSAAMAQSIEYMTDGEDFVNSPAHYTRGGIETIDFIEAKGLDYLLGNAVKYISRAGHKNPDKYLEDLQKARFYLDRAILRAEQDPVPARSSNT